MAARLLGSFYEQDTEQVAMELLGKRLVRRCSEGIVAGIIVETEAYLSSDDAASHSARGETPSNQSMFRSPGLAYVYPIHAKYCFNVVTEEEGMGAAVLIRALQPEQGLELIRQRRGDKPMQDWTNGPAKLCQSLAIDRSLDGASLLDSDKVWLEAASDLGTCLAQVNVTARIGITQAKDRPLRFFISGNRFVSGPKYHHRDENVIATRTVTVPKTCVDC